MLARLESVGLIDDAAFAQAVTEHHLTVRRSGRRAVAAALAAKGVARGTIETALQDLGGDDVERAEQLARERVRRLAGLPPQKAYDRLVAFLARRGYDAGVAHRAARLALSVESPEG